jgi:diaminopimelate decarboxylase
VSLVLPADATRPSVGSPDRRGPTDDLALDLEAFDLDELARLHDTPFYLYDLDVLERRVAALRAALPDRFRLAYAVKANPSAAVLGRIAELGLGADVASDGELERVLAAGIDPAEVVFTGPGKRDAELAAAVSAGVGLLTVESPGELRRLASIAAAAERRVPILLRRSLDPTDGAPAEVTRIIGDAGAGKFGMDDDDLRASAQFALDSPWLELHGVHAFGASNILDAGAIVRHVERTMAFGRDLAEDLGFPLRIIDVGGGLGIPYSVDEPPLDLAALRCGLAALSEDLLLDPATAMTRILIEPGRFLVGPAGAYVTRVVDTKRVRGRAIAIVDGGINHLLRPVLVQPQRIRRLGVAHVRPRPESPVRAGADLAPEPVTIAGPLCTGLDILARDLPIGMPEMGELLAVLDAGAYGYTESMPFFLSRPLPAEIVA